MSRKLHDAVVNGLTQLYDVTAEYSDNGGRNSPNDASKRRLAAAAAASVLGAGLDKLTDTGSAKAERTASTGSVNPNFSDVTSDGDVDAYWKGEDWSDDCTPEERREKRKIEKRQSHFIDLFFEKMLEHALPHGIPAREQLEGRITDPLRKQTDPLSVSKIVKNLLKITEKLGGLFQMQYFFIRIVKWTHPPLTLSVLVAYTLTVLHPNVLFIYPLLFLLYGVMIPGYVYRHPVQKMNILRTRERGDSLLEKFTRIDDSKPELEEFIEQARFEDEIYQDRVPELDEKADTSYVLVQKNMEFFVNMRDVQNNLTKLLKAWEAGEKFWYGTAGFKDERVSTSLFFTAFMMVIVFIIVGPYIPWRSLLIVNAWAGLLCIHPNFIPKLKQLNETLKPQRKELDKIVKESERKDITIDDEPEVKEIEVFEIWRKSLTTNDWEFYLFSNQVFDPMNTYRKSQTPPPGVQKIEEVLCPKSWKFDGDSWNIDYDCNDWCHNRGVRLDKSTFVDLNNEFLIDPQFKRRRLYRNVIRYSKPARKPVHLL